MVVLMCLETLVDLLSPDFSSFGASDLSILFCWPQAQWHKQMSVQLHKNGCFPSKSYVCDTLNKNNNNGTVESSLRFDAVDVEFILEVLPLMLLSIHYPRAVLPNSAQKTAAFSAKVNALLHYHQRFSQPVGGNAPCEGPY